MGSRDTDTATDSNAPMEALAARIKVWGSELGFQQIGITDTDLGAESSAVHAWLDAGYAGSMGYLERNIDARFNPGILVPDTIRIISARMDYLPEPTSASQPLEVLSDPNRAYISRYALGRDYHKVVRRRLAKLAKKICAAEPAAKCRPFTDSAPVLEKAIGQKSGLGWMGKHTLLLNRDAGSFFFLGEIYTNLELPIDVIEAEEHCGQCRACINVCPTQAIVAPRELDARRCISYLTIESHDPIPVELRAPIGNRVFGCDDCQLICPWNRYARPTAEADFAPRHGLDKVQLLDLFQWTEAEFLANTEGSAIRRINYRQWSRNLAVALGNADPDPAIIGALEKRRATADPMVAEHIDWALDRQTESAAQNQNQTP